jgi:hypothetical protein
MRVGTVRQMFAMDAVVTLTNTCIALGAAIVVAADARALPVLVVPALTVFAVYRAYMSGCQRHEKLELLYEANRTLSRSPGWRRRWRACSPAPSRSSAPRSPR